jgi:hypothetical protein
MRTPLPIAIIVGTIATISGCQSTYVCSNQACQHKMDLQTLAAQCLRLVEHEGPVTRIVVPDNLPSDARRAFELLRPIYTPATAPKIEQWSIAPGIFMLSDFQVTGEEADCSGILGPALPPSAEGYDDQCGKKFDIPFAVEDKAWASHSYKITECSSTNVIVPKE